MTEVAVEEECQGATPEVRNAIYAAKLKNARARNLGAEWEENAKIIEEAEQAAADCQNVRAKILANKAEEAAAAAIAALQSEPVAVETAPEPASTEMADTSPYLGGYLVVSGDNLWTIAGQSTIYGDPYMWPLIYKTNSGQIKDADLIFPGQYFYIPKAKGPERAAAIEHARNRGAWSIGVTEASDLDYLAQ
ncbi:MAG: LysM peptidoglycan-binding domain-containing protein [Gammaproteobacteria bacterium]|nr:LysM peptidoglycan-binding domain-containing protein [Gammaproteobacteria bacterium]MDH3446585.1 LysM peptidoglycan-binding domain-containing protein [Gammaproteobacteria bacterium]